MKKEEFMTACQHLGISLNETQLKQFELYCALLQQWNEKMNLTAIVETEEVYEKHFYDSLTFCGVLKPNGHLCDVGAGAGFPSLPLKIAFPDLKVTILEPLKKRCVFLNEVVRQLQLENVEIYSERAEEAKHLFEKFDIVTSRAVANLPVLSELCMPLVKIGGTFVVLKGAQAEAEKQAATHAMQVLKGELIQQQNLTLSDGSIRINLFYSKKEACSNGYPRNYGQIKKKPL